MIPEEDDAQRRRPPQESEPDTLAERRARRAWLGDAALLRRAEAAETSVRTLEAHLADLRARQAEGERAREGVAAQLAERELELRRVKQREYAEQQLRVEAEEAAVRLRRGRHAELDRWQRRAEESQAAARYAERQRDALAARLAAVSESCERLREGVVALQGVAVELRTTFELDHRASQARIRELEGALERARATPPEGSSSSEPQEAQRREEMAAALAAAVARLRARAVVATEQPQAGDGLAAAGAPALAESGGERARLQVSAAVASERLPAGASAAAARSETPLTPRAEPGSPKVSTVIVVPRLFAARGRSARRLAPAVRRVAGRLARWADRAQSPPH